MPASPTSEAPQRPGSLQALEAAERLHEFLLRRYWDGSGLVGPDMGIRFNYRVGRFVKSALRALPWRDDLYYLQAQAYWESANWSLYEATGERRYRDVALACAERMLAGQRADGGWDYPNPEWRSRTATTEGTWGALGLLEAYRGTGDARFLRGARRWWWYLERETRFQSVLGGDAVNYFAGRVGAVVPNCSSLVLHFLAELVESGELDAGERCPAIVTFLRAAQRPNGELPYSVASPVRDARLVHYQCYQYNAFEHLDLVRYHRLSGDGRVLPVVADLLGFLREGAAPDGHARYHCGRAYRRVTYHTAALAAAFATAPLVGERGYEDAAERGLRWLLAQQRRDGSFAHSRGDHVVLADARSYPRANAMIHAHLLVLGGLDRLLADDTRAGSAGEGRPTVSACGGTPPSPRFTVVRAGADDGGAE